MNNPSIKIYPKFMPPLDQGFLPAALENRAFSDAVEKSGGGVPLLIALERGDGLVSTYKTWVFAEDSELSEENYTYAERLVKTLLWSRGGWRLVISGPASVCEYIKNAYAPGGLREFDADFMGKV